jgi:hypothetical protein
MNQAAGVGFELLPPDQPHFAVKTSGRHIEASLIS